MVYKFANILEDTILKKKLYKNPTLTLHQLSLEFGTNRTYLSQYFNHELHTTFYEYINALRIAHAEHLIKTQDISLTAVCEHSGFNSVSTFHRAFRRIHGCTPSEYAAKYGYRKG